MSRVRAPRLRPVLKVSASVSKGGNRPGECDDRFSSSRRRFAVADGVSEDGYSDVWAAILADAFCRLDPGDLDAAGVEAWLDGARAAWQSWAGERSRRDVPWFSREMLRTGAHATFVGLAFSAGRRGNTWRLIACGDACAFLVRDDRLSFAFPLRGSGEFDNTPALVATSRPRCADMVCLAAGTVRAGDAFYLVTDALAHWFLARAERGEKPWVVLDRLASSRDLDTFVAVSRASGTLRDDDVTLLSIALEADA